VNVTLNTLFEAIQLGPLRGPVDDDDWKWTLRSMANRPILRVLDEDPQTKAAKAEGEGHDLKASLSFLAGSPSDGYNGVSDMSTGFSVEQRVLGQDTVGMAGNVGYGEGAGAAILRASYKHKSLTGSEPTVALNGAATGSARCGFPHPRVAVDKPDHHRQPYGGQYSGIEVRPANCRPSSSWAGSRRSVRLAPQTCICRRTRSSSTATPVRGPRARSQRTVDVESTDLGDAGPRVSIASFSPALERAHHQENFDLAADRQN